MRRVVPFVFLILLSILSDGFAQRQLPGPDDLVTQVNEPRTFQDLPYRLMKPIDLADHPEKAYPLVLSLHGFFGRGFTNRGNLESWNRVMAEEEWRRAYPCFVVAPQTQFQWFEPGMVPDLTEEDIEGLPDVYRNYFTERTWMLAELKEGKDLGTVLELLDELSGEFNIDADRVYVLGHSMGGTGTWNAIHQQPERFAAAIPTAGGFVPWLDARRIRDVPVWSFHGSADSTVPVGFTRQIFAELTSLGGNMKYTELEGMPHNIEMTAFLYDGDDTDRGFVTQCSSDRCDRTQNVWDWLFAQKRFGGPSTAVQKTSWGGVKKSFNE